MERLGPQDHIAHRRRAYKRLRQRSAALLTKNKDLVNLSSPSVQSVLSAASPKGLQIAVLAEYLKDIDHP
eukprot:2093613-Heterocapsa_arctica.AAC.1